MKIRHRSIQERHRPKERTYFKKNLSNAQRLVYRFVVQNDGTTRHLIAAGLGMPFLTVCRHVRLLLDRGELHITGKVINENGRKVQKLGTVNPKIKFRKNRPSYGKKYGNKSPEDPSASSEDNK